MVFGAVAIPLSQPLPWLATLIVFVWGRAIGDMNTLAVIEAGNRVAEHQVSTAMTAIALFYTLGSVIGPIVTGASVSYLSTQGLMMTVGSAGVLFILLLGAGLASSTHVGRS